MSHKIEGRGLLWGTITAFEGLGSKYEQHTSGKLDSEPKIIVTLTGIVSSRQDKNLLQSIFFNPSSLKTTEWNLII